VSAVVVTNGVCVRVCGSRSEYDTPRYSAAPDDKLFRHLATTYANSHTTMHSSIEFPNGITNGAHVRPASNFVHLASLV